jgi:hypothetical protein
MYVAFGAAARKAQERSFASLCEHDGLPAATIDRDAPDGLTDAQKARWAKTRLDGFSPFARTCYLDADTVVRGSLCAGFEILEDGWDLVIVPSSSQGNDALWHVGDKEREATLAALGHDAPLQLQAGVFWWRDNGRTRALFATWREEWERWRGPDQAALLRALDRTPVRAWLLGPDFNGAGGAVVEHRFGEATDGKA